jgi:protein-tyrosine phosphatase
MATYPDQITDNVFLGKANSAQSYEILQELGITHVLMIGYDLTAWFADRGIIYKHFELDDKETSDILPIFDKTAEFIDEAIKSGGRVLVHCQAGVSRSASVVIAWIMKSQGVSYMDAYGVCKSRRPCIMPNKGFVAALQRYQSRLCVRIDDI